MEPGADQQPVIFLNSVALYIQVSVKSEGTDEEVFNFSAPLQMNLGDFFNYFINQKRKSKRTEIETTGTDQQPYGWKFFTKGFMGIGMRELDPAVSLQKNKIRETAVITVRRVNFI